MRAKPRKTRRHKKSAARAPLTDGPAVQSAVVDGSSHVAHSAGVSAGHLSTKEGRFRMVAQAAILPPAGLYLIRGRLHPVLTEPHGMQLLQMPYQTGKPRAGRAFHQN